jgi:hypothetical protein
MTAYSSTSSTKSPAPTVSPCSDVSAVTLYQRVSVVLAASTVTHVLSASAYGCGFLRLRLWF